MALINKFFAGAYNYYLSNYYYYFYFSTQKLHKYIYKGLSYI